MYVCIYIYIYIHIHVLGWAWGLLVAINSYMLGYNLCKCSYNPYKFYNPLTKSPKSPEGYEHTYNIIPSAMKDVSGYA